jgi:hypothetical protein
MKKTLTAMTLLAGAVSVYSQGAVSMNDYGNIGNFSIQVFQAQPLSASTVDVSGAVTNGSAWKEEMGQPANSYLPTKGSTVYSGQSTIGPGYDVGLLALANGTAASTYSQLSLVSSSVISTWLPAAGTSAVNNNAGIWNSSATADVGPGTPATAAVAIAAWANTGSAGAATTLAQAQADGYAWGVSDIVTTALTTGTGSPGFLPTTLTSFSLATSGTSPLPEPSTIALGVIGASTLLFRRRK